MSQLKNVEVNLGETEYYQYGVGPQRAITRVALKRSGKRESGRRLLKLTEVSLHRQILFSLIVTTLLWAVTPAPSFAGPAASRIVGHRAAYNLSLLDAKEGAGVNAVDGRMVLEVTDACDGYTLHQRIVLRIYDNRGGGVTSDFRMTSWEGADGRSFRFNTREEVNGKEVQSFDGEAALDPSEGGGEVTLTGGDPGSLVLRGGTVFPTAHTRELIDHAMRGEKLLSVDVFDGTKGLGSLFATSAFVGNSFAAGTYKATHKGAELLTADPSWSVQVAYFPYIDGGKKRGELPEFEIGYRIFLNGVVSDLQVDYGQFEVSGALDELEILPDPGC